MKPTVCITMGDFNGIGPEVTLKTLRRPEILSICHPVLIGSLDVYEWYARLFGMKLLFQEIDGFPKTVGNRGIPVVHLRRFHKPAIRPGKILKEAGGYAGEAVEKAVELVMNHRVDAMVTAPLSKEAMNAAGYSYPGQTEMVAKLSGSPRVAMMLIAAGLRVGLVTVHDPLRSVPGQISKRVIIEKLSLVHQSLKRDFAIRSPKIAVLGLNPHAGENGMIGQEEDRCIRPAIAHVRTKRIHVDGPFPADGFFGVHAYSEYDAVLAMYHDQGLIPLKMLGFEVGVNFSAGLPLVRTSPDHGTAFDIAGKGIANPRSMAEAVRLAVAIVKNRKRQETI